MKEGGWKEKDILKMSARGFIGTCSPAIRSYCTGLSHGPVSAAIGFKHKYLCFGKTKSH